jgi:hypothetical protein
MSCRPFISRLLSALASLSLLLAPLTTLHAHVGHLDSYLVHGGHAHDYVAHDQAADHEHSDDYGNAVQMSSLDDAQSVVGHVVSMDMAVAFDTSANKQTTSFHIGPVSQLSLLPRPPDSSLVVHSTARDTEFVSLRGHLHPPSRGPPLIL